MGVSLGKHGVGLIGGDLHVTDPPFTAANTLLEEGEGEAEGGGARGGGEGEGERGARRDGERGGSGEALEGETRAP